MLRIGLIGWPVKHSLSPPMHEAAFRACGLDARYELVETPPGEVSETVRRLLAHGFRGWNATVPHKAAMATIVDQAEPVAQAADSVNTVVVNDGCLAGYSTDGYGLEEAIREAFGMVVSGSSVGFIGAGGAARACCMHFANRGVRKLVIANRTLDRASSLLSDVQSFQPDALGAACSFADPPALQAALADVDVVIQATSVGLHSHDPSPIPAECLPKGIPVMDMVYRRTSFLHAAASRGSPTADGHAMLLHQGARSFELWTGREAPVPAMRQALENAMANR
ncbi:MAG: shikimate dehydrogenase [Verrucomicrobiota bacterium]